MTPEQKQRIAAREEAATNEVARLANEPDGFRMSIPAQASDSDIILDTVCRLDVPALLSALGAAERREAALREALGAVIDRYAPLRMAGYDHSVETHYCRTCLGHWEQGQSQSHYDGCLYDMVRRVLGEG